MKMRCLFENRHGIKRLLCTGTVTKSKSRIMHRASHARGSTTSRTEAKSTCKAPRRQSSTRPKPDTVRLTLRCWTALFRPDTLRLISPFSTKQISLVLDDHGGKQHCAHDKEDQEENHGNDKHWHT